MDYLKQKRFTIWTIVVLVILNIFTISMLWLGKNNMRANKPPFKLPAQNTRTLKFLQKELDLTDSQIQDYKKLREEHAKKTQQLIHDIRKLKEEMMDEIFTGDPDSSMVTKIAGQIGEKQRKVEQLTFEHFMDLKKLCGEQQVRKLQGLVGEFFRNNPPPGNMGRAPRPPQPGMPPGRPQIPPGDLN